MSLEVDLKATLDEAAKAYVGLRLVSYPFPQTQAEYELLLQIAFMEGSQWEQRKCNERLRLELKEVTNARS